MKILLLVIVTNISGFYIIYIGLIASMNAKDPFCGMEGEETALTGIQPCDKIEKHPTARKKAVECFFLLRSVFRRLDRNH